MKLVAGSAEWFFYQRISNSKLAKVKIVDYICGSQKCTSFSRLYIYDNMQDGSGVVILESSIVLFIRTKPGVGGGFGDIPMYHRYRNRRYLPKQVSKIFNINDQTYHPRNM